MLKTLTLPIKRKWFDMIKSGKKREEYREIKPHWERRLINNGKLREFDQVLFINGYRSDSERLLVQCTGIGVGTGEMDWGAEQGSIYFIIELGNILPLPTHSIQPKK
ncbi:MAG: ASCH domain-containing protein [Bacteroidetes bacterium]|nr:MAG: ASCH domain-containing protein [Bacteroidota bacterium]